MKLAEVASVRIVHSNVLDNPLMHSVLTKMTYYICKRWNQSVSYDTEGEKQCQQT